MPCLPADQGREFSSWIEERHTADISSSKQVDKISPSTQFKSPLYHHFLKLQKILAIHFDYANMNVTNI